MSDNLSESAEEKKLEQEEARLRKEEEAIKNHEKMADRASLASMIPEVGPAIGAAAASAKDKFAEQAKRIREQQELKRQERARKRQERQQSAANAMNAQNSATSTTYNQESTSSSMHTVLVCLAALIIHFFFDVFWFDFSRALGATTVMFGLYMLFAFYISFVYYKTGFSRESGKYFAISFAAWALPMVLSLPFGIGDRLRDMQFAAGVNMGVSPLIVILTLIPLWFYYIILREKQPKWLYIGAYLLLLIFVFFLFLLLLTRIMTMLPGVGDQVGANIGQAFSSFGTAISDAWASIMSVFSREGFFNPDDWRSRINQTFNPRLAIYEGQVEENQAPQGVFITDVRSLYDRVPQGTDPIIFGRVETRTFLDQVTKVTPSCFLERGTRPLQYDKELEPAQPFDVQQNLIRDVTCTFIPDDTLDPGTYYGVLGASFDFETWSYVTYTFVGRDLILQYLRNNRDIHRDLEIPKLAESVYTNGPVEIGMIALQQPIDIDPDDRNEEFIKQNFGFTIRNRWSQGEIGRVYEVSALIPEQFQIKNCKPAEPSRERLIDGMRNYTWNEEAVGLDPRLDFATITCRLTVENKDAANEILSFAEKTPATFVVMAKYNYLTSERVPVRVIE